MIHPFLNTVFKLIEFNLLTEPEINEFNDFWLFAEKRMKPPTPYIIYLDAYNQATGQAFKGDAESLQLFYKQENEYSTTDCIKAIQNMVKNPYFKEKITMLSPTMALKAENLAKYINYNPLNDQNHEQAENDKRNIQEHTDFTEGTEKNSGTKPKRDYNAKAPMRKK